MVTEHISPKRVREAKPVDRASDGGALAAEAEGNSSPVRASRTVAGGPDAVGSAVVPAPVRLPPVHHRVERRVPPVQEGSAGSGTGVPGQSRRSSRRPVTRPSRERAGRARRARECPGSGLERPVERVPVVDSRMGVAPEEDSVAPVRV